MSEQTDTANGQDSAAKALERYRALDLKIDASGAVQLTGLAQRRIFAFGYYTDGSAPKHFKSWKTVLAGIELLQGMGVPALANLELLYEVGGKLTAMHKLCLAACQATGELEKHHTIWVNAKNEPLSEHNLIGFEAAGCIVYVRRRGQEQDAIGSFTMLEAEKAGLTARNKNYQAFGKDMLGHRASMRALSQCFADVLQGVRCKELEEMQMMVDESGKPVTNSDGAQLFRQSAVKHAKATQAFEALTRPSE